MWKQHYFDLWKNYCFFSQFMNDGIAGSHASWTERQLGSLDGPLMVPWCSICLLSRRGMMTTRSYGLSCERTKYLITSPPEILFRSAVVGMTRIRGEGLPSIPASKSNTHWFAVFLFDSRKVSSIVLVLNSSQCSDAKVSMSLERASAKTVDSNKLCCLREDDLATFPSLIDLATNMGSGCLVMSVTATILRFACQILIKRMQ